ncbi:MAG: Holliday junction resolvase RuvX [Paludibacteraceae bacterium]|nr:Holliday junction resolvase RuvX [Paludibacteraceae bacterium]
MGRILAIDYGQKRTGLAVTDIMRIAANPLCTIETNELQQWLTTELAKGEIDEVVIGKPTQVNGADSESMKYITPFMNWFRNHFPTIPLIQFDERFTSVLAHRAMIDGGMRRKQRQDKAVVDKIAATIILEDYLSFRL